MTRQAADRIADVKRLQEAARSVIAKRSALVPAIVESTGLSTEGVELGLLRHVEVESTDDDLAKLVAHAGDVGHVAVVLSANVFVGALRAMAIARAASDDVVVRPSRRDPAFARVLVEAARALGDDHLRIADDFDASAFESGEIHVYGRDETIAEVRAKVTRDTVRVRGHGSGMGVVWLSDRADLGKSARGIAEDVVVFDQRGCLSPRIVFVMGDETRASSLADALSAELDRLDGTIPRGAVPADERAAGGRYVATMTYACRALVGKSHAIGVAPPGAPLVLPPAYRHVHVAACASLADAKKLLEPLVKGVVIVGSDDLASAQSLAPSWSRTSTLGAMQRPPLDGPVDRRPT